MVEARRPDSQTGAKRVDCTASKPNRQNVPQCKPEDLAADCHELHLENRDERGRGE